MNKKNHLFLALTLFITIFISPLIAGQKGIVTRPACYVTSLDTSVNFATVYKGLEVNVLGKENGRWKITIDLSSPKVSVMTGWSGSGVPEGTGWISPKFIEVSPGEAPAPADTRVQPAPETTDEATTHPAEDDRSQSEVNDTPVDGGISLLAQDTPGDTSVAEADETEEGAQENLSPAEQLVANAENTRNFLEESKSGTPIIVVNIPVQRLRVYKNGQLAMDIKCRVGEKVHPDVVGTKQNSKTRVGSFHITRWHERYSNNSYSQWTGNLLDKEVQWGGFSKQGVKDTWQSFKDAINKGAFGAWAARINDRHGQMIHGTYGTGLVDWAVVNGNFRGYGITGSHGCVRLENRHVTQLQKICPAGTKVEKIYTLREVKRKVFSLSGANKVSEAYNIYDYQDVTDNGAFNPTTGELYDYHHPADAIR